MYYCMSSIHSFPLLFFFCPQLVYFVVFVKIKVVVVFRYGRWVVFERTRERIRLTTTTWE